MAEEYKATNERIKRNLGQCLAELRIGAGRNVWYCTKPDDHDGQHEATVKWGAITEQRSKESANG